MNSRPSACLKMLPVVTTVFADDLTGACEIAGIAHRHGFRTAVALAPGAVPNDAEVLVVDTETRLLSPANAAQSLDRWLQHHSIRERPGRIFKKIDSVLRGPIAAELLILARHTGAPRIAVVPANPDLGRVVRGGRYFIDDVPLDLTAFRLDPHHPVRSSLVTELIGKIEGFTAHPLPPSAPLPSRGLIIGDVSTARDYSRWAKQLPGDTLAAGSAFFFDALLSTTAVPVPHHSTDEALAAVPFLLVSGTTAPTQREILRDLRSRGLDIVELPASTAPLSTGSMAELIQALRGCVRASIQSPVRIDPDPKVAEAIRNNLAGAAHIAVADHSIRHLIVEGGATAAAIGDAFSWHSFRVMHEWAQGVVTVSPDTSPELLVTLKPGSYPWPSALLKLILPPQSARQ